MARCCGVICGKAAHSMEQLSVAFRLGARLAGMQVHKPAGRRRRRAAGRQRSQPGLTPLMLSGLPLSVGPRHKSTPCSAASRSSSTATCALSEALGEGGQQGAR